MCILWTNICFNLNHSDIRQRKILPSLGPVNGKFWIRRKNWVSFSVPSSIFPLCLIWCSNQTISAIYSIFISHSINLHVHICSDPSNNQVTSTLTNETLLLISARLDGTGDRLKTRMAAHTSIKDWLELDDTRDDSPLRTGQKRVGGSTVVKYIKWFARCFQVRWADIEQRKRQARTAQFGFVVGQRNWATQEDREAEASSALAATKIIPNRFHSEFHN